jgi:tyrosine-specific transport protein
VCVTLTLVPPLIIALFVPQLFLKALSFAGMVLVIIALLLPLWLIHQPKAQQIKAFYTLVEHRGLQLVCLGFGLLVILCEMTNMLVWRG